MKAKKNNAALTRTSAFREDRKNYLTEDGYTYYRWDEDPGWPACHALPG